MVLISTGSSTKAGSYRDAEETTKLTMEFRWWESNTSPMEVAGGLPKTHGAAVGVRAVSSDLTRQFREAISAWFAHTYTTRSCDLIQIHVDPNIFLTISLNGHQNRDFMYLYIFQKKEFSGFFLFDDISGCIF